MLEGRDVRVAGLGLAAFILIRLPEATSGTVLIRLPPGAAATLVGLDSLFAGAGLGFGGACSIILTAVGRRNIPLPI